MTTKFAIRVAGAALVPLMMLGASAAFANPDHDEAPNIGQAGDVSHIDRVIQVDMGEMYFTPSAYAVEKGETVKFEMVNTGRVVHEFAIGTEDMQKAHQHEGNVQGGYDHNTGLAPRPDAGSRHDAR